MRAASRPLIAAAATQRFRDTLVARETDPRMAAYVAQIAKQHVSPSIPPPKPSSTIVALTAPVPPPPQQSTTINLPKQVTPTELVRSALTPRQPQEPVQQQPRQQPQRQQPVIHVNMWGLLDRAKTALVYYSMLDTKQVMHKKKIAEEFGTGGGGSDGGGALSGLRTTVAGNLEQVVPQSPSGLLPYMFNAKDLPEIRGMQPNEDSFFDNLYVHLGGMVGEVASSLIDESVAAEKAAERNGNRCNTTIHSPRMLIAKYLQECVAFSPNSWRPLSEAETQAFVTKMQQKDANIDWARVSREKPSEFSQAMYYDLKKEGKISEAHSLFAASNTLQTEAAGQWRDVIFKLIKGTNLTLSRKAAATAASTGGAGNCGPNSLSTSHFGVNRANGLVDIPCSIVSLDSLMAKSPRTRTDVMPFAVDGELYDHLVDPASFPSDDYCSPRDIGLRMGPLERQETDLYKVLNEFFVPIPIVLTHNYKVDTHEFGLFSGELARVINFYMHTPSEQVYALVQLDPTSDELTFVHVDSSNYEPVDLSMVELRSELLNSFGRVLHLNRSSRNPKNPYTLYKKYKHAFKNLRRRRAL